ncbi:MAG: HAD family phosphatase [Chlamydiales bacterium]|nr:HAD family phosphatase [Chlamydiia bacterium]MCP5504702.1 HAD family phosphatase [Chlamydiales bacterium]
MTYKTLIFDLGNVLVDFSHEKMFNQMAALTGIPSESIYELLFEERTGHQYERGLISTEEIYQLIQKRATTTFEMKELIDAASTIFSPKKEMELLVKKLKEKEYKLLLLSNTFEPHFNYIAENYTFLPLFDHWILSYQVGYVKPEKKIYEEALKHASCLSSECFFIDDRIENIRGAEVLGIKGHQFRSPSLLMDDLIRNGIV